MKQLDLPEIQTLPEQDPFKIFEEQKREFLEKAADTFYCAYLRTNSQEYRKVYMRLMNERIKCRV